MKNKIFETLQIIESDLWLRYASHIHDNAPKAQGIETWHQWKNTDPTAVRYRKLWFSVREILVKAGIDSADNEATKTANELFNSSYKLAKA